MTEAGSSPGHDSPFAPLRASLGSARLTLEPAPRYPLAIINVTNRCNLHCDYCFVFREGNPNDPGAEMSEAQVLAEVERLRDRHGVQRVVWMGGEPMLRWRLLRRGVELFPQNTISTNGTVPLRDFGPTVTYVISLDGPPALNDAARGEGVFARAMETIAAVPEDFGSTVMVQCVVHRQNQEHLHELAALLRPTRVQGLSFSFLVPRAGEVSPRAWESVEEREAAVDIVCGLKRRYSGFIWNAARSLELMRPATARLVTDHCPIMQFGLPLYLEGDHFTSPLCCYGNDVDCDRCGAWAVFSAAAKLPGPWNDAAPPQ